MTKKQILITAILLMVGLSSLFAQPPCLQGYIFRSAVSIINPDSIPKSGVVELKFRAEELIENGQMLSTCADIRFMISDTLLLRHWLDENSEKTNSQSVWVELSNLAPGSSIIYMFYGNPAATSQNDTGIFDFFDDFHGNSLSTEWNLCQGNPSVSGGFATLGNNTSINTAKYFPKGFMAQAHVTRIGGGSMGRASFGQLPRSTSHAQYNSGYKMAYNSPTKNFEVYRTTSGCHFPDTSLGNTAESYAQGIWSFSWKTGSQVLLSPPGVTQIEYTVDSLGAYSNYGVSLSVDSPGTMEVDWVAVWRQNRLPFSGTVGQGVQISTPISIEIAGNTQICNNGSISLSATNYSNAYYTWSYNNTIVKQGNGSTAHYYTQPGATPVLSGNYSVAVNLGSPSCGTHIDEVNVTVYPEFNVGTISDDTAVCAITNSGTVRLIDYGGTIDYWEYRILPGSVWNPQTVKSDVYGYSGLSQSYSFRAHINNGICSQGFSPESQVMVSPTSVGGILSESDTVCQNSSATLSLTENTGDIMRWERKVNATWDTINLYDAAYTYPSITNSTQYRVLVKSGVCPAVYSNTITRTLSPPTVPGSVTGGKYVCAASSKMDTLFLQSHTGNILKWEFSPSSTGPWSTNTSTSNYFLYQGLNNTTYYRTLVQSPGCAAAYSAIDTVIVEQQPTVGTLNGSALVCATSNSGVLQLSGYTGRITSWFSSNDLASWLPIGHNFDTLHYNNLQNNRHYRAMVNSQHNVCVPVTSNLARIDVSRATVAGELHSAAGTRFCADSNRGVIRINNKIGNVISWEKSKTGTYPWDLISGAADSLNFTNLTATDFYRVIIKSGACPQAITPNLQIRIDLPTLGGTLFGSDEFCEQVNNDSLILTGSRGSIVRWQSYTNGPDWSTLPYASTSVYAFSNLTNTTQYRVIVKNGQCKEDTSTIGRITVNPLPDVSFSAPNVNLGNAVVFQNTTTIAEGSVKTWFWDFGNKKSSGSSNPEETYTKAGTYRVKLTAESNKFCLDSASKLVTVYELPDVSFTFTKECAPSNVRFENTSSVVAGTNYFWDFGDGKTALDTGQYINHFYTSSGKYHVTLKAVSTLGGVDSIWHEVPVYQRAIPSFEFDNICEGQKAVFENSTTPVGLNKTYEWDFGNGTTSKLIEPNNVLYDTNGFFLVKLKVTTGEGCIDSTSNIIRVFPQPRANFTVENVPYQQPSFFFNNSDVDDNGKLKYTWDFGDGKTSDTTNPIYYYQQDGTFTVILTAISDSGCSSTFRKSVTIFPLPVAKFTVQNVCFGDSSRFDNLSTSIPADSYRSQWDFGDNQTSAENSPVHYYQKPGEYQVRLITISVEEGRDTAFFQTIVYDLPKVDFNFNEACDGFTTFFNFIPESAVGDEFLWDFGNRSNSVQPNPEHLYTNPGVYAVKVEVTTTNGCTNNATKDVIVHHNPIADFATQSVCVGRFTEFVNYTTIDNTTSPYTLVYSWNFDDGSSSTAPEPEYRYSEPGLYRVLLTVTSDAGCVDTLARNIEVYALPDAYAGEDTAVVMGYPIVLSASGGDFYEWMPETGLSDISNPNAEARPMETTMYTLRVADIHSCVNYDTLLITVDDAMKIEPSNVLTPNDNNENDTWYIVNIDSYADAKITIFDRWGKMIYETTNYQNDWTGVNNNGDILPDGTYYYVIVLNPQVVYKGAITILRDK